MSYTYNCPYCGMECVHHFGLITVNEPRDILECKNCKKTYAIIYNIKINPKAIKIEDLNKENG